MGQKFRNVLVVCLCLVLNGNVAGVLAVGFGLSFSFVAFQFTQQDPSEEENSSSVCEAKELLYGHGVDHIDAAAPLAMADASRPFARLVVIWPHAFQCQSLLYTLLNLRI